MIRRLNHAGDSFEVYHRSGNVCFTAPRLRPPRMRTGQSLRPRAHKPLGRSDCIGPRTGAGIAATIGASATYPWLRGNSRRMPPPPRSTRCDRRFGIDDPRLRNAPDHVKVEDFIRDARELVSIQAHDALNECEGCEVPESRSATSRAEDSERRDE